MNLTSTQDNPFENLDKSIIENLSGYLHPKDIKSMSETCTFSCDPKNVFLQTMLQKNKEAACLFLNNFEKLNSRQKDSVIKVLHNNSFLTANNPSEKDLIRKCAKTVMASSHILTLLDIKKKILFAILANDSKTIETIFSGESSFKDNTVVSMLQFAVKNECYKEVDGILQFAAQADQKDVQEYSLNILKCAIKERKNKLTEYLLHLDIDIKCTDDKGNSLLHHAALHNNAKAIILLMAKGMDKDVTNSKSESPLHFACKYNHQKAIEALLKNHADPCLQNCRKEAPLHIASYLGYKKAIELLLKYGANIECLSVSKDTPLQMACRQGHIKIVQFLFENGAKIDVKNQEGLTPFHEACQNGHKSVVQFLLEKNEVLMGTTNNKNQTPLHIACVKEHLTIVKILLKNKELINDIDDEGNTPLHLASQADSPEICEILLHFGANINATNSMGRTPLSEACDLGNDAVVEYLLENNAAKEIVDFEGNSALHLAASTSHSKAFQLLLEDNAHFEIRNNSDWTPLHFAVQKGRIKVVQDLIKRNAEINTVTSDGKTPLALACERGWDHIVGFLLDHDAKCDTLDTEKNSPFHTACKKNYKFVIQKLLSHGIQIDRKAQTYLERNASDFAIQPIGYTALHHALDTFDFEKALELVSQDEIDLLQKDSLGRSVFDIIQSLCKRLNIPYSTDAFCTKEYIREKLSLLYNFKIDPTVLFDRKVGLACLLRQIHLYRDLSIHIPNPDDAPYAEKIYKLAYGLTDCFKSKSQVLHHIHNNGNFSTLKYVHKMFLLTNADENETKGMIVFHNKNPKTLMIDVLSVDPSCKRQKLGTILLLFATKIAQRDSNKKIVLYTSKEGVFLYHSFGFRADMYTKDEWEKLDPDSKQERLIQARNEGAQLQVSLNHEASIKIIKESLNKSLLI